MSDEYLPRKEHEEFCRRIDTENTRQNRRIELLEENVHQIGTIMTSVEKLAVNMEGMLKEQEKQGERLKTLEARDGEKWRQVAGYTITAVISLVVGYIMQAIF